MSSLGDALNAEIDEAEEVDVKAGGKRARADVKDADRIGVVLDRLRVDGAKGSVEDRTQRIADSLAPGGEKLVPIEVDGKRGRGILRSKPEDMKGGRFFEVDVDKKGAEVTRHKVTDGNREKEPFTVTREQLGDMTDQLAKDK